MPFFNDMAHMSIKRFADDDPILRPGALRARALLPWDALAESDPSGRALCKGCGEKIPKGNTRLVLLMQCCKGYKTPCTLHFDCFWGHPETAKLVSADEIHIGKGLGTTEAARVRRAFETHRGSGLKPKKEPKSRPESEPKRKPEAEPATGGRKRKGAPETASGKTGAKKVKAEITSE